jgi:hypothetical protein
VIQRPALSELGIELPFAQRESLTGLLVVLAARLQAFIDDEDRGTRPGCRAGRREACGAGAATERRVRLCA